MIVGSSHGQPGESERHYRRLDSTKNEIRLLNILPVREVDGKEHGVECNLSVTSLDDAPAYRALSYAWGDQTRPEEIFLDGHPLKVGPNLCLALWQLQSYSRVEVFWIDALCINQSDDSERSEQVSKMRAIYERAEEVVVWLGRRYSRTASVFSLLENLYEHRLNMEYVANSLKVELDSLEEIINLFRAGYWHRIWVIQEVNSARKIIIQCGKYKIDWLKVKAVQEMLWADHDRYLLRQSSYESRLLNLDVLIVRGGVKALEIPRCDPSSNLPDLYTMISTFWTKAATDPRDKIFALVGLTTARDDPRFVIDYAASVRRVYINVVEYIITSTQRLDVICSMPRGNNDLDLPSWVSDWTVSVTEFGLSLNHIIRESGVPFGSARASTAEIELKHGENTLAANGILLDRIQVVGQKGSWKTLDDFRSGIPILLSWYRLLALGTDNKSEQIEAFCRTIFYDRFSSQDFIPYQSPTQLWHEILAAIVLLAEENCPDEAVDPHLVALKAEFPISNWWAKSWLRAVSYNMHRRRSFVSDLELIGLCPAVAEPGDIICILLGCHVPVVLRPLNGHYILLGWAYVHDYMYGKAMDELAEGKFQLQSFEIH